MGISLMIKSLKFCQAQMKFAMFCVLENTEYVHSICPLNEAKKNLQNVKEKNF